MIFCITWEQAFRRVKFCLDRKSLVTYQLDPARVTVHQVRRRTSDRNKALQLALALGGSYWGLLPPGNGKQMQNDNRDRVMEIFHQQKTCPGLFKFDLPRQNARLWKWGAGTTPDADRHNHIMADRVRSLH